MEPQQVPAHHTGRPQSRLLIYISQKTSEYSEASKIMHRKSLFVLMQASAVQYSDHFVCMLSWSKLQLQDKASAGKKK